MAKQMGIIFNLTSPYFEPLEDLCEPASAASKYCRWALGLSLLAVGGHMAGLIELYQRRQRQAWNRPNMVGYGGKEMTLAPLEVP